MHSLEEVEQVLRSVADEVSGYGPLEGLLRDEGVSEIMVVGPRLTYVEREGKIREVRYHFEDEGHMMRIVENILRRAGRHGEQKGPMMNVRLPDGTLVNIVMPPPAIKGPTITMRKPSHIRHGLTGLVRIGSMSQDMADFLATCVRARLNIVICGERRSGRTTLLNALAACIQPDERIVTIEEMAELRLSQKHVVTLEACTTISGEEERSAMRDLFVDAGVDEKTGRGRGAFEPRGVHPACFKVAASAR
jgi:pilus assembly protein CpaF